MNQSTGALTQIVGSPFATGVQPNGIAYSPVVEGNLFSAVANYGSDTVSSYQVNLQSGEPVSPISQAILDKYCP